MPKKRGPTRKQQQPADANNTDNRSDPNANAAAGTLLAGLPPTNANSTRSDPNTGRQQPTSTCIPHSSSSASAKPSLQALPPISHSQWLL
jgi:hypothetical protein